MNYIVEDGIDFQTELYKLIDCESEDEDELCQITGCKLEEKHVELECKHKFNYTPLYTEICKQKFLFNTYDVNNLNSNEYTNVILSGKDYFIKCPYCRNIQFTILPFYEELELEKIYGINCLNKTGHKYPKLLNNNLHNKKSSNKQHTIIHQGLIYKFGHCHNDTCNNLYVYNLPNTNLSYCPIHYKKGFETHVKNTIKLEKKKEIEYKKQIKKELSDKKIKIKNDKIKILEKINAERVLNGLKELKRLPKTSNTTITYDISMNHFQQTQQGGCSAILSTGKNKGKLCGCKKIVNAGMCKRHQTNYISQQFI